MLNKESKAKLINQLDTIYNWNLQLADNYENPKRISQIRNIIFLEIGNLRNLINSNYKEPIIQNCLKSNYCKAYMSKDYENGNYKCIESIECNDFIIFKSN